MKSGRRQQRDQPRPYRAYPIWRPLAWSAVTTAAIAALFTPVPAMAAPVAPAAPAIPDSGMRPVPVGSLTLPGQGGTTAPGGATGTGVPTIGMSATLAKIEKQRAAVALLGNQVVAQNEEVNLARTTVETADRRRTDAHTATVIAEQDVTAAATDAFRDAAALPPGTLGSDLVGFGALAGIQRGEGAGEQAAGRHLVLAREAEQAAITEFQQASARLAAQTAIYNRLNTKLQSEQAALQKLEADNIAEVAAQDARERAEDLRLGAGFTGGDASSQAADPRALAAVTYFLAQRGDPYVWGAEGPDAYDCSGGVYAAYRTKAAGSFPIPRVSRDQYLYTDNKLVDRYSLLPGDLLFFSSSSSWTGIHHVAMYAGRGMMVEAPRTGLNVRLVPVRWTRLFAATRIYGPVPGPARVPPGIDQPDPSPRPVPPRSHSPAPHTTTKPPTTKPDPDPDPKPPASVPPESPSAPAPSPSQPAESPPAEPSSNTEAPPPKSDEPPASSSSGDSSSESSSSESSSSESSSRSSSPGASSGAASSGVPDRIPTPGTSNTSPSGATP